MKKRDPELRESYVEGKVVEFAKEQKILVYKFTSPSRRSVPDRLFVMPGDRGCFFVEFKAKGEKTTLAQEVEIAKIRSQGIYVGVVDNVDAGKRMVEAQLMF